MDCRCAPTVTVTGRRIYYLETMLAGFDTGRVLVEYRITVNNGIQYFTVVKCPTHRSHQVASLAAALYRSVAPVWYR
jgi:hypothetical protein